MKTAHFVTICLNCYLGPTYSNRILGAHDRQGRPRRDYLESRIPLMRRFTLRSLLGQSNQRFFALLLYDKRLPVDDLLDLPEIARFAGRFRPVGVAPIDFRRDVKNAFWRPRQEEDDAMQELSQGADRLLITYLDSDDSLRDDAVARIQELPVPAPIQCIMPQKGYLHDSVQRRLRRYDVPSPPFFTLAYRPQRYFAGQRYHGGAGHHYHVCQRLRCEILQERIYMVNIHSQNDSSSYAMPPASPDLTGEECQAVLRRFGC